MIKTGYSMSATTKRYAKLNIEIGNVNNNGNTIQSPLHNVSLGYKAHTDSVPIPT